MIHQAIIAIMVEQYDELWKIEPMAKEYHWLCPTTKQTFLDLLNDIHQRPEEEAQYFLSALRLLRDQLQMYEHTCYNAEKMMRNRLKLYLSDASVGDLANLPKEILFTISTKLL